MKEFDMTNEKRMALAEKFQSVAFDLLNFVKKNNLYNNPLHMMAGADNRKFYKLLSDVPACHGSWIGFMYGVEWDKDDLYFLKGAEALAQKLGFSDYRQLEAWACSHPDYWGNEFGSFMFSSPQAFGGGRITLVDIANHYIGVAWRLTKSDE